VIFDYTGMIREPKYGHLRDLHRSIKLCEQVLVSADPTVTSLGSMQEVCLIVMTIITVIQMIRTT
jgi:hypothetical protein